MRFIANGPIIPDDLLTARDAGRVVFLCGAGVSAPSGLPGFKDLTEETMNRLRVEPSSDARIAFQPWIDDSGPENSRASFDLIFNILQQSYDRDQVGQHVADQLSINAGAVEPSREHQIIAKLSADRLGNPQIVTTNFDRLFEHTGIIANPKIYEPPTFPDLRHNRPITGITYLHGRLNDKPGGPYEYILSSADFGRAYLAEAWATRFIRMLLEKYTVVLLGYQANDPPVKYLLQGLTSAAILDKGRLFAFDKGEPEEIEAKWRDRGVTPISYHDHPELWDSLEAWAERAKDPKLWRSSIIAMAAAHPSVLQPHERGQVAHLVRSTIGAKEFADAVPSPPAEWLCVFDRSSRMAKKTKGYGEDAEEFDPQIAFGLDDDPPRPKDRGQQIGRQADDLISWMTGDQRPTDQFRLAGRSVRGFEEMPARLFHLSRWISANADQPIVAWWAAQQAGLHPMLLQMVSNKVESVDAMPELGHRVWNLLLDYLDQDHSGPGDMEWFRTRKKIKRLGWTPNTLRDFEASTAPFLHRDGLSGLAAVKPPVGSWDDLSIARLTALSVKFPGHRDEKTDIPDDVLRSVFDVLNRNLVRGVERLNETEHHWFVWLSPYERVDKDEDRHDTETGRFIAWYYDLLNRMVDLHPSLTAATIQLWPTNEPKIFDKLRLFVWNRPALFTAVQVASQVMALDNTSFWNSSHRRELLRLLRDRWPEIDQASRILLEERIAAGRDQHEHDDDGKFLVRRSAESASILTWLVQQGCEIAGATSSVLAGLKAQVPDWSDEWANHADDAEFRGRSGFVTVNTEAGVFDGVPISEIVNVAIANTRDFLRELTDYRPFTGLVKAEPAKALAALVSTATRRDYPVDLWKSLIHAWPDTATRDETHEFHERLKQLPARIIQDLRHYVGPWMRDKLPAVAAVNETYALSIFDAMVDGLLAGGAGVAESAMGEVTVGGEPVSTSRRTLDHAINGPLGHATEAWITILDARKLPPGSELPIEFSSGIERLLAAPGEGSDHALTILGRQLNWLNAIVPMWVADRLLPTLAPNNPVAEPMWNGVFHSERLPNPKLFSAIKHNFLGLFPKMYEWGWDSGDSEQAHNWLVLSCIWHVKDPEYVSYSEAISCIRRFSQAGRTNAIHFLGQYARGDADRWSTDIIPFIENAWPGEARYQVESTSVAFLSLFDDAGESFLDLYEAVKPNLRPIHRSFHGLYGFYKPTDEDAKPVAAKFPEQTLDLMNRITPDDPRSVPYDLGEVLTKVAEASPDLARDVRFSRLSQLVAER